jgi:hypothetical protein
MPRSNSDASSLHGLRCPKCRYDLSGLSTHICPECGTPFDPAALTAHRPRRRWIPAILLTLIVLYAPFGWLLFISDDLGYILSFLYLWPVLPGLPLTFLIGGLINSAPGNWPTGLSVAVMAAISFGLIVLFTFVGSRGIRLLMIALLIALALSIVNSYVAFMIFSA